MADRCAICHERAPAPGAESCDRCWELKRRIDDDPDLALRALTQAFIERAGKSALGEDLRDEIIAHVGKVQAWDADADSRVSDWYEVLVDGVRGLSTYSDEDLLQEFSDILQKGEDESVLGEPFAARLRDHALWKKILAENERRADGGLAE
jgi:hypothetical protein